MSALVKVTSGGNALYSNAPFRAKAMELIELGESWSTLCRRVGMTKPDGAADTSHLKRSLGLMDNCDSRGRVRVGKRKEVISYELAVRLCDALGLDYVDIGV